MFNFFPVFYRPADFLKKWKECQNLGTILSNVSRMEGNLRTPLFTLLPPDHLLLNSAHNLGPLISRREINKFENCWFKSVRILEVLKLLLQQFLNLSSSQQDMSGPILGDMSNGRWSRGWDFLNINFEIQDGTEYCVFFARYLPSTRSLNILVNEVCLTVDQQVLRVETARAGDVGQVPLSTLRRPARPPVRNRNHREA